MTVGLYCRVSTDEQAQQGFSIENQQERLIAYCASQGWSDYRLYIDDGYTGTNMDRPALQRLLRHIKQGKIDTVVVYKLDRLGRKQQDIINMLSDEFEANGVAFKSATEPFDTGTPLGKAMIGILAVFAQLERDTIVERTTMGRRQRVRKGKWYGGRVPFGYEWDKDAQLLTVNPQQADLVKEIYRRYLNGFSYNAIAEWVSERTNERTFDHGIIRDILRRPIYTGRMNNAGDIVDGSHDAIIDVETWERVQQEMLRRRHGVAPAGTYLLSGLLQCGVCGGPMIHITMKTRGYSYDYYVCKKQHVRPKGSTETCTLGFKKQADLEQKVIQTLQRYALDPKSVTAHVQAMQPEHPNDEVVKQLEETLQEINQRLERWYDAFETGELNPKQVRERVRKLEEEKQVIETRLFEMEPSTPDVDRTDVIIDSINLISASWDYLNDEERQGVLRAAIKKIVVQPGDMDPQFVLNV